MFPQLAHFTDVVLFLLRVTVARSCDFHREMFGCERLQKIPRVEDLRRRADSLSLEVTVKDARGSFDNDRRRDRVNVAPRAIALRF